MDIETLLYNGVHYLAVWCYTGSIKVDFVVGMIEGGSPEMLQSLSLNNTVAFIKKLFMIREYVACVSKRRQFIIYAHNMGGFDGIFILKPLIAMGETNSNIIGRGGDISQLR
jgi:hypothetical protein